MVSIFSSRSQQEREYGKPISQNVNCKLNWLQTHYTLPTNVDGIVGHHVLVVVESMLNVILLLLVTKKPLQKS